VEADACHLHLPRSSLLSRTDACDRELGRETTFVPSDTSSYSKSKRSALGSYRLQIDGRRGIAVLLAMIACQAAPILVQRSSIALLSQHVPVPPPQSQRSLAHSSIVSLTLPASEVRSESP
jgi:hypothetical protein